MTYRCEHFSIHELVPEEVYEARGEMAWELLDERLLRTLDKLRDEFGPVIVNNWFWGKDRKESGLRIPGQKYYSPYSQHTFGRAADCLFKHVNVEWVRESILKNPSRFPFITGIEMNTSWLHVDVRNCKQIKKFYP